MTKAKADGGRQDFKVEEEDGSDDEEAVAKPDRVVYTAVSRDMAICDVSKARRDHLLRWPWSKTGRTE